MKKLLAILSLALSLTLTSCNPFWESECIKVYGRISTGLGADKDNLVIELDKGWFVDHSRIVVNYRDSVLIMPLTNQPETQTVQTIR